MFGLLYFIAVGVAAFFGLRATEDYLQKKFGTELEFKDRCLAFLVVWGAIDIVLFLLKLLVAGIGFLLLI